MFQALPHLPLFVVPNVYILIGFNSVSGQTLSDPIVKLLPLTNATSAHDYFSNTRTGSNNGIIFPPIGVAPSSGSHSSGISLGTPTPPLSSSKSQGDKPEGALDLLGSSSTPSSSTPNGPTGSIGEQVTHSVYEPSWYLYSQPHSSIAQALLACDHHRCNCIWPCSHRRHHLCCGASITPFWWT